MSLPSLVLKSRRVLAQTSMIALAASGVLAFAPAACAQANSLSIESAVSEGIKNSPAVQRAEASSREADWVRIGALSGFLPSVSLSATHFFSQKYVYTDINFAGKPVSFPGIVPSSTAVAQASMPIFDGFSNLNRYASARASAEAASLDYDWAKFQISEDIRMKFYQALAAQKLALVADENVKTIEEHLNNTKLLKRGGVSTNFDVLRTEVQMSEAQSDRVQAQDNVAITRQLLNEALGNESDTRPLVGELPEPPPGFVDKVQMPSPQDRPDVRALEKRQLASAKTSSAQSSYLVPQIALVGSYTYYNNLNNSATDTNAFRNAYQFGVQLTWNIFDGMRSIAASREASYRAEAAAKSLRIAQLKMPTDFEAYRRRYNYSSSLYRSRLVNVERAQESVRLARVGYKAGIRINSEVLDSQLELFRARAGAVSAQLAAAEAVLNLELATGQNLNMNSVRKNK